MKRMTTHIQLYKEISESKLTFLFRRYVQAMLVRFFGALLRRALYRRSRVTSRLLDITATEYH